MERARASIAGVARVAVWLAAAACWTGCDDGGGDGAPKAARLEAKGALETTFDGQAVVLDYSGLEVATTMTHKINPEPQGHACVVQLDFSVAKADGACQLDLKWGLGTAGLHLTEARFHAVKASTQDGVAIAWQPCPGWPEQGKTEIVYVGSGPDASISLLPLTQPHAGQKKALVDKLKLTMSGLVEMKAKGKKFTLDLGKLSFSGAVESQGRNDVTCGTVGPKTGVAQCPTGVTYGDQPGTYLRRANLLYRCDDGEPYDLGELCGHAAIWVTDHRDWSGVDDVAKAHRQIFEKFKDQALGAAFVVVEGKEHVVVPDPAKPGDFVASGPAPTQQECQAIGQKYDLHPDVVLLFDKDKKLLSSDSKLAGTSYVPAMVFAKGNGQIVSVLPPDVKPAPPPPTSSDIEAAITAAIEAE